VHPLSATGRRSALRSSPRREVQLPPMAAAFVAAVPVATHLVVVRHRLLEVGPRGAAVERSRPDVALPPCVPGLSLHAEDEPAQLASDLHNLGVAENVEADEGELVEEVSGAPGVLGVRARGEDDAQVGAVRGCPPSRPPRPRRAWAAAGTARPRGHSSARDSDTRDPHRSRARGSPTRRAWSRRRSPRRPPSPTDRALPARSRAAPWTRSARRPATVR